MKKKIAILGSTGSIGKQTLEIIRKDKKNFKLVLITANRNISLLCKQIKEFNVQNVIVSDNKNYNFIKKKFKNRNIFNNLNDINKILKSKVDYTMSSISGIDGLKPTLDIIKFSKTIAIANKESIICGWPLIKKKLKKYKTEFIPVDSEHFSIWSLIKDAKKEDIKKIIITASGGPFLNFTNNKMKKISLTQALRHPNWKMGKKITVDSATLMNKVFEVIEAKKIFDLSYDKFKILIHPKSYLHAIVIFNKGLIKFLAHETNMKIPIFNSIYNNLDKKIKMKKIDFKTLNNLNIQEANYKKFPVINILKKIPKKDSLFETVLVSVNDELVNLFLKKKINFNDISKILIKLLDSKSLSKFKRKNAKNLAQIEKINDFVRLKTKSFSVLSAPK